MAFNLTNTQVHVIPHQHQTSDIPGLVELIQANAVVVSPTAPENPNAGKLWYNTTKGVFNIWNGSSWILIGPEICPLTKAQYDALSTADKNDGRFYLITDNDGTIYVEWDNIDGKPYYISSTAPSTPAEGNLWYDTTNDVLKVYDGTNWNPVNTYIEYVAGTNVQIDPSTHEISATDTTYTASDFDIKDLTDSTDLRTTWSGKQDAINDLSTIRSGAAAGATAVQPLDNVSGLTNDAGYITNSVNDLTNYYTKTQTYTKAEVDQMISDFGGFEVVEQLPAVSTANPHIIYLLGPIGTGGDQYEEWIVTESCTGAFESESTINHESISYSTSGAWGDIIWNSDSSVTNVYVGVNNAQFGNNTYMFIDDNGSSNSESELNSGTAMPWIGMGGYMSSTPGLYEVPMVGLYGDNGVSFDLYYSDSELSWNPSAVCVKQWTKIGETSVDLSNYFNTFTDTADSITAGTNNLFVSPSEKSTWSGKQDALVEGTGIDIDSSTNEISVDTTVVATQTDIANFFDKTSDDADDIDDTNSTNKFVTASEKSTWSGKQDALTAGDNISIDSNTNTISADVNTKTFPMAFATKVDDAQAAIDWVLDGNNALIDYDNRIYLLDKVENGVYYFRGVNYTHNTTNDTIVTTDIEITVVSDEVTEVHIMGENHGFLETNRNYSTPFIPTQDGHPATKKYVDEHYTAGNGLTLSSGQFDVDTSIIATKTDLYNLSSFEVVQVLPSVAQADAETIYILGPIGDGADKYEEWIVTDVAVPGYFTSTSEISHTTASGSAPDAYGVCIWNNDRAINNVYVGITNAQFGNNSSVLVSDLGGSSDCAFIDSETTMPWIGLGSECDGTTGYNEYPQAFVTSYSESVSIDIYWSDDPLTWVPASTAKAWIKIGETSPDLSGKQDKATSGSGAPSTTPTYVGQMYVDTTNDNLYVATGTSSSSDWTAVDTNTTYTAGDRITITNNEISADKQFEVVDTLPLVEQASEDKIYILGPIGTGADKYEEYVLQDAVEGHWESASEIKNTTLTLSGSDCDISLVIDGDYITNTYVAFDNVDAVGSSRFIMGDDTTSTVAIDLLAITTPYAYDILVENPQFCGEGSVDAYASDSPLTWVPATPKQFVKIGETSQDLSQYVTQSQLTTALATKQDTLVSGTNIKTVNNNSLLGSGNIDIPSGKNDIITSSTAPSDTDVIWKYRESTSFANEYSFYNGRQWLRIESISYGNSAPNIYGDEKGILWYDFGDDVLKYYDNYNDEWKPVGGIIDSVGTGLSLSNGEISVDTTVIQEKLTAGDGIDIDANNEISVDVTDIIGTGLSEDANNNLIVDSTVVAMQSDLANYYTKTQTYTKTEVDNLISSFGSFEVVDTLPAVGTASEKTIYLLGPIGTGTDKYEEWIVTNEAGHFESASTITHVALSDTIVNNYGSDDIWNQQPRSVQNVYIGINNLETEGPGIVKLFDWNDSQVVNIDGQTSMPYIYSINSGLNEDPSISFHTDSGPSSTSFDLYYSDSPLTWNAGGKVWTKIGETSIDLSGYATTSAMNAALLTKANVSDLNTKTFYLTGTTGAENIAAAQEALDWYNAGKNPIIIYQDESYHLSPYEPNTLAFIANKLYTNEGASSSSIGFNTIIINYSGTTVSSITMGLTGNKSYLEANKNYATPYTPQYSGSPATKKYVDDNVVQKSSTAPSSPTEGMVWYDTTNDVLKVYDGTNWNATGKTYEAGTGIKIANDIISTDISAGDGIKMSNQTCTIESDRKGPAPSGFHVPAMSEWVGVKTIMTSLSLTTSTQWKTNLHLPPAGYRVRSDSSLSMQGNGGYYWSSTHSDPSYGRSLVLTASGSVMTDGDHDRALGRSIRAFKNEFVTPNSDWTVISGTLGGAGIFWDEVNGLISITDGTDGYTIMDKNLGATTVYNNGDTLTEANMGYMYQWGNNYGFPSTGSVTTSSTQVNTTNYGPTNYYSDNTFITGNANWSTVNNGDLWGDTSNSTHQECTLISTITISADITTGSTAPATTPEYVGQQYIDTTNDKLYIATGTSSSSDWMEVGSGGGAGDMLYADFNWATKTGASITLDLNSEIEPSSDFTVNAPATIKDGQIYVLRVTTGLVAYTMTLGTNITNPYNEDLTLDINTVAQFSFVGINNKLELQPSIAAPDISGKQDKATSGSGAPATTPSYIGQQYVDTTNDKLYVATGTTSSSDWIMVDTNTTYAAGTNIDITSNVISAINQFEIVSTLPSGDFNKNKIYILGPIGTGADKYEEWIYKETGGGDVILGQWIKIGETSPDLSGKQDKATSGSTAPATTPSYIGQQYVDTTADKLYVATGTSSSSDWSEVGSGSGDMLYQDFNWVTKTGATITLDLNSTITPSANFTVNAPATIKDGQIYILRVVNGATAYTMTLGTGITNPYSTSTTLTANYTDQFVFQAVGGSLELLPDADVDITGKQDKATSGSSAPATTPSYVGQSYVNTSTTTPFVATGTSASTDWQGIPILSKQTGAATNVKIWVGTQAAYEALSGSYDSNTLYFTTTSS